MIGVVGSRHCSVWFCGIKRQGPLSFIAFSVTLLIISIVLPFSLRFETWVDSQLDLATQIRLEYLQGIVLKVLDVVAY